MRYNEDNLKRDFKQLGLVLDWRELRGGVSSPSLASRVSSIFSRKRGG